MSPVEFYEAGAAHFQFQDWAGTERVQTSYNGGVEGSYSSLPYGDGYSASGTDDDAYHFAMLDQDKSSDDHAMFREYSNISGRWMSPDPYSGSYNIYNPQSFNRYSYVMNNPLGYVDPLGLGGQQKVDTSVGSGNACDPTSSAYNLADCLIVYAFESSMNVNVWGPSDGYSIGGWDSTYGFLNPPYPSQSPYAFDYAAPFAPNKTCIQLSSAGQVVMDGLSLAAKFTGHTLGFGLGGSLGAGNGMAGLNLSGSLQLVASPDGTTGVAVTYISPNLQGMVGFGTWGAGAIGGAQFSASTVQTVGDLGGSSLDFGGYAAGDVGFGFDNSYGMTNSGPSDQVTFTLGFGEGAEGRAAAITKTIVFPTC